MSDTPNAREALTPERLKEIAERCEKASRGPWTARLTEPSRCQSDVWWQVRHPQGGAAVGAILDMQGDENDEADAAFIAAARSDLPALLAEVARLREYPALLGAECDKSCALEAEVRRLESALRESQERVGRLEGIALEALKSAHYDLWICTHGDQQDEPGENGLHPDPEWRGVMANTCELVGKAIAALALPHRGAGSGDEGRMK